MQTEEFGAWTFIFYLTGLFALVNQLFPFWATRFVARNKEGAVKTAVTANLMVAGIATAAYLLTVSVFLNALHITSVELGIYLIAAIQIINTYLVAAFEACLRAVKPQATGYGLLVEEAVKLALAYSIFLVANNLFLGAIVGIVAGASVQALFYGWLLRDYLHQKVHWGYLREWLRGGSVAFIYNAVGSQLLNFVFYVLVLFGGEAALGDYQAALIFSAIIGYASSLSFALYPKMLAENCPEDVAASFRNTLMLALPMAVVALTMSTSLLTILKASYAPASPVLILLTADAMVVLVSQFYTQCLMGTETLDVEGKISIHQLMQSKIFKVFTLSYVQAAIALPTVYILLTRVPLTDAVQAAEYVSVVYIVVHAVTIVALYALMHREFRVTIAWISVAKYMLAAFIAAIVLLVLPQTTTLLATFSKVLIGIGVYAAILLAIDADARTLVKQIIEEIRSGFR